MRSIRNEFYKVCDFQNLLRANRMARRGKACKYELQLFENELTANIMALRRELENGTYKISAYRKFKIYEPKERDIMSLRYRDRVVQHALCDNVLEPFLDPILIYDNAACRKGKGTHFALDRVEGFMRKGFNKWGTDFYVLKCDVRKYFYSIDHTVLREALFRHIEDEKLKWLLDVIIDSVDEEKGVPIGNMTSQWFAVFYLDALDRYIKEELKIHFYGRYMDDFLLFHNDREYLKDCLQKIKKFLSKRLKLELNEKTQIFPIKNGVDYLGFHLYLTETGKVIRKLRNKSKRSMKRKIHKFNIAYANGEMTYEAVRASVASWVGHAQHGDTYRLRKKILGKLALVRDVEDAEMRS